MVEVADGGGTFARPAFFFDGFVLPGLAFDLLLVVDLLADLPADDEDPIIRSTVSSSTITQLFFFALVILPDVALMSGTRRCVVFLVTEPPTLAPAAFSSVVFSAFVLPEGKVPEMQKHLFLSDIFGVSALADR